MAIINRESIISLPIDLVLRTPLKRRVLHLTAVAMAVSACGGGGGSSEPPPTSAVAPQIAEHPADTLVTVGQSATFRVKAQSSTSLSYQWLRNNVPIQGATAAEFSLTSVNAADSGSSFSVKVSNAGGSVQSTAATLLVKPQGWTEGIALASGVLQQRNVVGFSKSGDFFVFDTSTRLLTRVNPGGATVPLAGGLNSLPFGEWSWLSVLEHSDRSLYICEGREVYGNINVTYGNGGRIQRIAPDGAASVVYDSDSATIRITPCAIAEGSQGRLYALHVNTVSLYEIKASAPVKIADLAPRPVSNLNTSIAKLSLVGNSIGDIFASGVGTETNFDIRMSPVGTIAPVRYGSQPAYDLGAHGNHVYALTSDENRYACLVRLNADGSTQRIAGGVKPPATTDPAYGLAAGFGPLPGWLHQLPLSWHFVLGGNTTFWKGVDAEGRIALSTSLSRGGTPVTESVLITPPFA